MDKTKTIKETYIKYIRPLISDGISQQRLKLIWYIWGYYPLFSIKTLSLVDKLKLLVRYLIIDWNVEHSHSPFEISMVCQELARRYANPGEILLEAGCWKGGASAKFSIICKMLGYVCYIYDSFEGVEITEHIDKSEDYDFSGEYSASENTLRDNLGKYGQAEACLIYKGWFCDTLARGSVSSKIKVAFIDCDLAKGTKEALMGIVPCLVDDGCIFSQDYHIKSVQKLLNNRETWGFLNAKVRFIEKLDERLAIIKLENKP
jgi:O-methyltransferase